MIAYILPYLIVFTSPQEFSAVTIPRNFDVNLHATKLRTLVQESEYFQMPQSTIIISDVSFFPYKRITNQGTIIVTKVNILSPKSV